MSGSHGSRDPREARQALYKRRRELQSTLNSMREGALSESLRESLGELSMYDNHPADLGTETFRRSQQLAIADLLSRSVGEVDAALERVRDGTYGICERCGRPIVADRLKAMPEARNCVSCQQALDQHETAVRGDGAQRPVEEEILSPPFARTWNDGTDKVGFDGEDAWQAVAQFGSSDTPSDVPGAREYPHIFEDADERHGAVEDVENLIDAHGEPVPDIPEDDW